MTTKEAIEIIEEFAAKLSSEDVKEAMRMAIDSLSESHDMSDALNIGEAIRKLKPCPFCGGGAVILKEPGECSYEYQYQVVCPHLEGVELGCGASTGYRGTLADAVKAWNMRTG